MYAGMDGSPRWGRLRFDESRRMDGGSFETADVPDPKIGKLILQEMLDMPKEISHGTDVKKELLEGICQLGDTVSPALGPKGRNTVLTEKGRR